MGTEAEILHVLTQCEHPFGPKNNGPLHHAAQERDRPQGGISKAAKKQGRTALHLEVPGRMKRVDLRDPFQAAQLIVDKPGKGVMKEDYVQGSRYLPQGPGKPAPGPCESFQDSGAVYRIPPYPDKTRFFRG